MAKVIGLGGIFIQCADVAATKEWYKKVIGDAPGEYGGWSFVQSDAAKTFPKGAQSIFAPFEKSDYFKPSELPFMINLMVNDLEGVLKRLEAEGIEQVQPSESYEYGKFAWLMDPDGRKVELWEPVEASEA